MDYSFQISSLYPRACFPSIFYDISCLLVLLMQLPKLGCPFLISSIGELIITL